MPIRGSPNGANALVHAIHTPDVIAGMGGRHQSERVDVINRNRWSSSSGAPTLRSNICLVMLGKEFQLRHRHYPHGVSVQA